MTDRARDEKKRKANVTERIGQRVKEIRKTEKEPRNLTNAAIAENQSGRKINEEAEEGLTI